MGLFSPNGFKISFVGNPFSWSAANFFFIILKLFLRPFLFFENFWNIILFSKTDIHKLTYTCREAQDLNQILKVKFQVYFGKEIFVP